MKLFRYVICTYLLFSSLLLKAMEPTAVINGLAIYKIGEGKPALLMPYPHASTYQSMSESKLVNIFNELGYAVYTFDSPGIFKSVREADVTLKEMLSCTDEVVSYFKISVPFLLVGHSQGGFCSLAFAIEYPDVVERMVLVGTPPGWPAVLKGSMHRQFPWYSRTRWEMMVRGTRKMIGCSNLKNHKKLDNVVATISFHDQKFVQLQPVSKDDRKKPDPARAKWMVNLRKYDYDYSSRLNEINIPVLIAVGQFDPQTPVKMNEEIHREIRNSAFHIFAESGHSPFVEEPAEFRQTVADWLVRLDKMK